MPEKENGNRENVSLGGDDAFSVVQDIDDVLSGFEDVSDEFNKISKKHGGILDNIIKGVKEQRTAGDRVFDTLTTNIERSKEIYSLFSRTASKAMYTGSILAGQAKLDRGPGADLAGVAWEQFETFNNIARSGFKFGGEIKNLVARVDKFIDTQSKTLRDKGVSGGLSETQTKSVQTSVVLANRLRQNLMAQQKEVGGVVKLVGRNTLEKLGSSLDTWTGMFVSAFSGNPIAAWIAELAVNSAKEWAVRQFMAWRQRKNDEKLYKEQLKAIREKQREEKRLQKEKARKDLNLYKAEMERIEARHNEIKQLGENKEGTSLDRAKRRTISTRNYKEHAEIYASNEVAGIERADKERKEKLESLDAEYADQPFVDDKYYEQIKKINAEYEKSVLNATETRKKAEQEYLETVRNTLEDMKDRGKLEDSPELGKLVEEMRGSKDQLSYLKNIYEDDRLNELNKNIGEANKTLSGIEDHTKDALDKPESKAVEVSTVRGSKEKKTKEEPPKGILGRAVSKVENTGKGLWGSVTDTLDIVKTKFKNMATSILPKKKEKKEETSGGGGGSKTGMFGSIQNLGEVLANFPVVKGLVATAALVTIGVGLAGFGLAMVGAWITHKAWKPVGTALAAFTETIDKIGWSSIGKLAVISLVLVGAVAGIALAGQIAEGVGLGTFFGLALAIGALALALFGASLLLGNPVTFAILGGIALVILAIASAGWILAHAITMVMEQFTKMGDVDFVKLGLGLLVLALGVGALMIALYAVGAAGMSGVGFLAIQLGLYLVTSAIESLIDALSELDPKHTENLANLFSSLVKLPAAVPFLFLAAMGIQTIGKAIDDLDLSKMKELNSLMEKMNALEAQPKKPPNLDGTDNERQALTADKTGGAVASRMLNMVKLTGGGGGTITAIPAPNPNRDLADTTQRNTEPTYQRLVNHRYAVSIV